MPERTTRGDEDRRREDEQLGGTPTDDATDEVEIATGANATRDRGTDPAPDAPKPGGRGDRT
ncbi:MAG TPA: hypothetical protein VM529_07880 [Gemmata sp.]|nr:hypothetical protein [Gemmata sp.]